MKQRLVALGLSLAVLGAACSTGTDVSSESSASLAVVSTTTVLADFAKQIGGDRVDVYGMLRPNVDPHDYEPSPRDLEALRKADVIVRNGVGLEAWFDDTIRSSGTRAAVVDASTGIAIREEEPTPGAGHAEGDPHIWHDPRNAERMVATIAAGLEASDPEGASTYRANLARYTAELEALDRDIASQLATLPDKKLVTNHDAFGYYVDRYGLEFVGSVIPSFDTSAELSAAGLDDLVAAIRAQGVKAVFSESSLPAKAARTIAEEAGVRVVDGESALYGDGLGPKGSGADTYVDMMRHNTDTIVSNLR